MSECTPGPWRSVEGAYGQFEITAGTAQIAAKGAWARGAHESWANGRLIAAAPDLLEWLKRCLDQVQGRGPPDWDGIRAVIAKAEGTTSPQGGIG